MSNVTPWDPSADIRPVPRDARATGLTYEPFYGLREKPFRLTSDSRFFYQSRAHAPAFEDLLAGIRRRESLNILTGDIGTGKTTLCRAVLPKLDRKTFSAFVPDPFASREDLLKILLMDFGVASVDDLTSGRLRDASRAELSYLLYEFLGTLAPLQAFAVVFIDEAQNLSVPLLEEIRILSDQDGLLQIVLVGQLELRGKLKLPEMRNLDQRVSVHSRLQPLDAEGVAGYISHRLHVAGGSPDRIRFTRDAVDAIYHASVGVPRAINRICDRALHLGHARRSARIDREIVEQVVRRGDRVGHDAPPPAAVPADVPSHAPEIPCAPAAAMASVAPGIPSAAPAPRIDRLSPPAASAPPAEEAPQFVDPIDVWLAGVGDLSQPASASRAPIDPATRAVSLDPTAAARERRAERIERFLPRAVRPSRAERLARKWTRMTVGLIVAALVTFVVSPIALELSADALDRGRQMYDPGVLPERPSRPKVTVGAPPETPAPAEPLESDTGVQ